MADFWSIVVGIVGTATILGGIYGLVEIADARQHARYRRAQQNRVKSGRFIGHYGSASK